MELILVILLIMVVLVLLNRPKKQHRGYTSTKTEPTSGTRETPSVIPGVNLGEKDEASPQMALKTETVKQIEPVLKIDNDSVQVNTSSKTITHTLQSVNGTIITINGKSISGVADEEALDQLFARSVGNSTGSDFCLEKEFEEAKEMTSKERTDQKDKQKAEERKKKQELNRLRREFDAIVKFIWPEAEYEYPYDLKRENSFANVMFHYDPYKNLYGMYEHLLTDYPKKMTPQQKVWITDAVKTMFQRAAYIFYNNDDSILEEYKYLRYSSHIREVLFNEPGEFPNLIAAMAAWAIYQGDGECLKVMLSQYEKMEKEQQIVFIQQLSESMSRPRKDIFKHSMQEITDVIDTLQSFEGTINLEEHYGKDIKKALVFLKQGRDEKAALDDLDSARLKEKQKKTSNISRIVPEKVDDADSDRSALFCQLSHVRWKYNVLSENPEDQEYIKRNIRSFSHIDWEDVDHLIDGDDRRLASQMYVFKETITQLKKYKVWNKISKSCPRTIEVKYKYPDGKAGDINRGLALCYGADQPEQLDALNWKVDIDPRKYYDIIDMMVNGRLGVINDREETERIQSEPQARFLIKYNNYAKLRAMISSVYSGEALTKGPYFSIASSVQSNYYHQLRETRDLFYQELIVTTGTSAKWKSEQQVYAVVRYDYPDAVYQYHTEWLGLQSLDVFIPSLSVGIEYQGIQHYEPIELFGGEEGFRGVVERDKRKRQLCADNGVRLIYWRYDEPVNADFLHEKMASMENKECEYKLLAHRR